MSSGNGGFFKNKSDFWDMIKFFVEIALFFWLLNSCATTQEAKYDAAQDRNIDYIVQCIESHCAYSIDEQLGSGEAAEILEHYYILEDDLYTEEDALYAIETIVENYWNTHEVICAMYDGEWPVETSEFSEYVKGK